MTGRGAGLIDPSQFPLHGSDLDVGAIRSSAEALTGMGRAVADQTGQIAAAWQGLTGCYVSPDADRVYALMGPAVTSADDLCARLVRAGSVLGEYADTVARLRGPLVEVEAQAVAFRARALAGVRLPASSTTQAGFGDFVDKVFDWVPGVDERTVLASWYDDTGMVAQNTDLLTRYDALVARVSDAAASCANAVQGLMAWSCVAPATSYTAADLAAGSWWGAPVTEDRNCMESTGNGFKRFGVGFWDGMNTLIGHDVNARSWSWDTAGASWLGLGNLVGALAAMAQPGTGFFVSASMWATWTGHPELASWIPDPPEEMTAPGGLVAGPKQQGVLLAGVLGSLIGMDTTAADKWHRWREDAWSTGTTSVLNIGTFFIPGAGEVGAGLKGVEAAGEAAEVADAADAAGQVARASTLVKITNAAGHVTELVVPGGSWVLKGGVKVLTGLDDAFDTLRGGGTGVGHAGGAGGAVSVLVDSLDHVPDNLVPHTPVSDKYFGTGTPRTTDNAAALHDTDQAGATTAPVREPVTVGAGGTDAVTGVGGGGQAVGGSGADRVPPGASGGTGGVDHAGGSSLPPGYTGTAGGGGHDGTSPADHTHTDGGDRHDTPAQPDHNDAQTHPDPTRHDPTGHDDGHDPGQVSDGSDARPVSHRGWSFTDPAVHDLTTTLDEAIARRHLPGYDPTAGQGWHHFLDTYFRGFDSDGIPRWRWPDAPPHTNGFTDGISHPAQLHVGDTIERITFVDTKGELADGAFAAPVGTPFQQLSLPPDRLGPDAVTVHYEVLEPLPDTVRTGDIAPGFGQPGGGTQYYFPDKIEKFIELGYLKRIP